MLSVVSHLIASVGPNQLLEFHGQLNVVPDVLSDALCTVHSQDEPQLQGAEAAAQRQLPVLEVDYLACFRRLEENAVEI